MKPHHKHQLVLLFILPLLVLVPRVFAQEATTESTDSAEIKSNIQKRIQQVLGNDQNPSDMVTGLIGKVESLTSQGVTIQTENGTQLISVDTDTTIVDAKNKTVKIEDIEVNGPLLVIGTMGSNDIFNAQKISELTSLPTPSAKKTFYGPILDINTRGNVLTFAGTGDTDLVLTIITGAILNEGFTDTTLKNADLEIGDKVIVVYEPSSKNKDVLNVLDLVRVEASASASPVAGNEQ